MAVKVGDVVAWDKVPSGTMVREERRGDVPLYTLRIGDWYRVVGGAFGWRPFEPRRPWHEALTLADWVRPPTVTIIALDVPANATADDLRVLAERFEVRAALESVAHTPAWFDIMWDACEAAERKAAPCEVDDCRGGLECSTLRSMLAERLHAAGWRPSMTAEDAARMLAEARDD